MLDDKLQRICQEIAEATGAEQEALIKQRDQRCAVLNAECVDDHPADRNTRLWRAVLATAIIDFHECNVDEKQNADTMQDILRWFKSRSFPLVCQYAGYDPEYVLNKLRQHRQSANFYKPLNEVVT